MKMPWKSDKSPAARAAKRAMLARRNARHVFYARMRDAFTLSNKFQETKMEDTGAERWFDEFEHNLEPDFFHFAYYTYRFFKYQEGIPKKYSTMWKIYNEIRNTQMNCASAREKRRG